MTVTIDALLAAGYRKFHDTFERQKMGDWYRASYQKRVTDQYGTRYFITINHSVMPARALLGQSETNMFTPSHQFRRDGITFNVSMQWDSVIDPDQVEAFFADLWEKMRLDYYEEVAMEI
jgi:hypothetical protein